MDMKVEFFVEPASWEADGDAIRAVREAVFMQEQGVPADLEWDGRDADARHFLVRDSAREPIGTVRLLPDGTIGRMAVVKRWRCRGVGHALLTGVLETARQLGMPQLHLNAQLHALSFYQGFGFVPEGAEFIDAGIPHRRMTLAE